MKRTALRAPDTSCYLGLAKSTPSGDWLNPHLLEAAVFITAMVLLCCFAVEEYAGRF